MRNDKKELLELISSVKNNLDEIQIRKNELLSNYQARNKQLESGRVDDLLIVNDYLVSKVLYTDKKA